MPPRDLRTFTTPGKGAGLADVLRRRYLLSLLVRKEVRVRYRGSVLGWLWSYVKPAFQFLVFFLALGVFLRQNASIPNYPIYLFAGLILVNVFSEAFSNGTKSLIDNGALIKKIYMPRELFPVSSMIVAFVNFLPQVVILLGVCLVVGWRPNLVQILGLVLGVILVLILALGLGMLFGAVNVSFRDSQNFVELIVMVATWASPVLYQWQTVARVTPDWLFTVYMLNPVTIAVELFHTAFWLPTTNAADALPAGFTGYVAVSAALCLVILAGGQLVFRKLEGRFAQDL